ncbi:cation diffusion facilitator family transporter [Aequorivita sp. F47161]|uniref:Cation diffusion facilitator family transporter n=1 Tax=Aequorivita vitellina TaxID=2874475 RepID=A0A9X1U3A0_9FLAO|nr:cation diffusion facilitator family transporter [Aequorivita vitellina]MCG2419057.1 cation diffusion facilitator family transporter [Aequorivita vitellina]
MILSKSFELPNSLRQVMKDAKKLEWITLAYMLSVIVIMFLVMGSSQAMKTAWLEDALSTLPAIAFLVATKIYDKPATKKYPYGYHKVFGISFLTGSVALFGMGSYLAIDSIISLLEKNRPTIGTIVIFKHTIWMGWIMILALIYSALPAMWLGYKKLPLAKKLHNKILHTDATTQKADYMTAFAAIVGILGIGIGLWWMDAAAAIFISVSVIKDGFSNLKSAIADLMERRPQDVNNEEPDPLIQEISDKVSAWPWVKDVRVRFREHGQVYFGEIYIIPKTLENAENLLTAGKKEIESYHWKIFDVTLTLVKKIET